jgi:cyclopropane fatty-acyl-phospholipid synthase-like methyltransferase
MQAITIILYSSVEEQMSRKDSGWWDDFFPTFRPVFDIIPVKNTNAQVRFIIRKLGLKPGMQFLDCPCGIDG